MNRKPTKKEAKKVATAVKRMFMANREDLPYVADKEYFFSRNWDTCQEIHWEGGDFEWAVKFADYYNSAHSEFFVEPYNGFVLCVYRNEDYVKPAKPAKPALTQDEEIARAMVEIEKFFEKHGEALGKALESAAIEILTNPVRD